MSRFSESANDAPLTVRLGSQGDCEDIFLWRNDETTRVMSVNTDEVSWDDHQVWFGTTLADPTRKLYIAELPGEKIGLCRFDLHAHEPSAEVSINLNPTARGRKLSARVLRAACEEFLRACPSVKKVIARIRAINEASLKCFQAAGFRYDWRDETFDYYCLLRH